jgi:hypothetical protein
VTPGQPLGQERQADAESTAAAIDAVEAARPPFAPGSATVTPPATEDQRLQAALQLESFFGSSTAAIPTPRGYSVSGRYLTYPAGFVADATDPAAALHKTDEQWRSLVSARLEFTAQANDHMYLIAYASVHADAASAKAAATGSFAQQPGWTSTPATPPFAIGDSTYAFRGGGTGDDGNPAEDVYLYWTHGPLVLGVRMLGPVGTTSMDQVVALAQQLEARFQANPLPTSGVGGL